MDFIMSNRIEKFLDSNRKVLSAEKNKPKWRSKKFQKIMETYTPSELQEMVDKRFLEDPIIQKIYNEYDLKDAECVVDMGSGCGLFEGRVKNLVNLDMYPYPHVNLLNDMRCTELKDNVADRILVIGSHIWNRPNDWRRSIDQVMKEIYRVAKPGCIMICYCNSITICEHINGESGGVYDKGEIIEWIHSKHEVADYQFFLNPDGNISKKRTELNSRGHNRRVGRNKDKMFWAWIL